MNKNLILNSVMVFIKVFAKETIIPILQMPKL